MTKKLSLIILLFTVSLLASAQIVTPIKWRSSVKMTDATHGVLTIKAIIDDGWHLYGTKMPEGGPRPTVFDFSASRGIKFTEPFKPSCKPVEKYDKLYNAKITFWDKTTTFSRPFVITNPNETSIEGKITFMGCNDVTCLAPTTQSVKLKVPSSK